MSQEVGLRRNNESSTLPSGFNFCAEGLGIRVFTQAGPGADITRGGDDPDVVDGPKLVKGGALAWHDIIYAAMRLQSLNAVGQAGLLIGAERLMRIDAPASEDKIRMDDWTRASTELPGAAKVALDEIGEQVAEVFLKEIAEPYA